MDTGASSPALLAEVLRASRRTVWVRALLGPAKGRTAPVIYLQAVVGRAPDGWEAHERRYELCSFVSATVSSSMVAAALDPTGVQQLQLGRKFATLQARDSGFGWDRHPGLARYDQLALKWPSVRYEVPLEGAVTQLTNDFLVGRRGTDSFHTASGAFNRFFFNDPKDPGSVNFSLGKIDLRIIDGRAYFKSARVRPTSIRVVVGGRSLRGCDIELTE